MASELKSKLTRKTVVKYKITKLLGEIYLNYSDEAFLELVNTKCDKFNNELKESFDKIYSLCNRNEDELDKYFEKQHYIEKDLDEILLKIKRCKQK